MLLDDAVAAISIVSLSAGNDEVAWPADCRMSADFVQDPDQEFARLIKRTIAKLEQNNVGSTSWV